MFSGPKGKERESECESTTTIIKPLGHTKGIGECGGPPSLDHIQGGVQAAVGPGYASLTTSTTPTMAGCLQLEWYRSPHRAADGPGRS